MKLVSLQTKILGLIISLILLVTILLTGIIAYLESEETTENMGQRALQIATTVSLMPSIKNAFKLDNPEEVIQPIAEGIRKKVGAEFIVVGNAKGIRYSHPDQWKLGKYMVGDDNTRALVYGEFYTSQAVGSLGPSLRGKAPILNEQETIVGLVSVGFMVDDIKTIVFKKILKISSISLLVLAFGILGGILLARNIRKDTLGLEPYEIASLFRDRNAILLSIKEGIIAINHKGYITMMNHSAKNILGYSDDGRMKKVEEAFPNTKMYEVLKTGISSKDEEMTFHDRAIIVNRTPIIENHEVVGVVASFRDKTEVNEMLNALSEVRRYSEDLRAQTHEYTNKLYVLSGLLQLKHYDEAIELIQKESSLHLKRNKVVLEQIKDKTVQAILLGKISKASEKKVDFHIDENTLLGVVPEHIDMTKLITILGNLIDNSIEAVEHNQVKQVNFFATDIGEDIIFDITDNGVGIEEENIANLFKTGFSTKNSHDRGYGLSSVKEIVDDLRGGIEVYNKNNGGAVFSVFIPKQLDE